MRLPKEASKRDALAVQIGAEGYALMDTIFGQEDSRHLRQLPALGILRQMWLHQYYRCTAPGMAAVRWRGADERPPAALHKAPCGRTLHPSPLDQGPPRGALEVYVPRLMTSPSS